jgi:NADH:ubiquinone oxidoreductase subunit F (NADH-binding)
MIRKDVNHRGAMTRESAQSRGVRSFYAQGDTPAGAIGVCRGLSCELNGGPELEERLSSAGPVSRVHCFGYCDRAPAASRGDGEVLAGAAALALPGSADGLGMDDRPDIRSAARRAVVTERIGRGRHDDLGVARAAGVYAALEAAVQQDPAALLNVLERSGEQGRGGAGFPTAAKWRACASTPAARRYVIANGDEGDPGAFIDRVLLEDDPHAVLEGLALCAWAVGAGEGIVFIRGEYPRAQERMRLAIVAAREAGILGPSVLGSPFAFDVRVVSGHGSYVCGEETALLNAIEGRRGEARVRPPYPAESGLHGCPTVVNNIETLLNVPWILRAGPEAYRALGVSGSPGTKAFCLGRGFARPGIVEAEFGLGLRELIETHGGGGRDGVPLAAVALGGPMGSLLTPGQWDVPLDPVTLRRQGIRLGHGGLVPIPASADLAGLLRNWTQFMALESCGKCTPCALGSRQAVQIAVRMGDFRGPAVSDAHDEFRRLLATVEATSLCGFGQGLPQPLMRLAELARRQATGGGSGG